MKNALCLLALIAPTGAVADGTRQLDAHEHGVGVLNMALDGAILAIEFRAPGADIVGFEYRAQTDEDRAATASAIAMLAEPLGLFVMPEAAGCEVSGAQVNVEGDTHDVDHDDHDDHEDVAGHTEFHASYSLTCANPAEVTDLTFAYFSAFPNAREVQVQLISNTGAMAYEVDRDTPFLELGR